MKKLLLLWMTMLLSTILCACSEKVTTYTVEMDGVSYVVDTEKHEISDGTNTYRYEFSGDASAYGIKIKYPDGSGYWSSASPSQAGTSIVAVGIFNLVSPYSAWYLEYGWRYKNAEPSDLALQVCRVSGGVAILAAIILLCISWI